MTRVAAGGTRLVLAREQEILARFREALGADGTQLALLILRAGRGPAGLTVRSTGELPALRGAAGRRQTGARRLRPPR